MGVPVRWGGPGIFRACICATALALCLPAGARADSLLSDGVRAGGVSDRDCTDRALSGLGVVRREVTAPSLGVVEARLDAEAGDWDLAVFDARDGRTIAGGATGGPDEVAQGFVLHRTDLVVQACRRSGDDETARLSLGHELIDVGSGPAEAPSLVRVPVSSDADVARLQSLGFDLTEHGGPGFVDAVLHGADDGARLTGEGFSYDVLVANLTAQSAQDRAADAAYARSVRAGGGGGGFPSGQTTYRHLFDYSEELKALADDHPKLVRYFTLKEQTYEGRDVEGIEIGPRSPVASTTRLETFPGSTATTNVLAGSSALTRSTDHLHLLEREDPLRSERVFHSGRWVVSYQ